MSIVSRPRYAVYFTPPSQSALWRFGSDVIGYDAYAGAEPESSVPPPLASVLLPSDVSDPRRYGFHATLRAPFELADGCDRKQLLAHAAAFATRQAAVSIGALQPRNMRGFVALVCRDTAPGVSELASACVRDFEPLRAQLSSADRARRLEANLTRRQLSYLDAWGYPYVLDDFLFHMTLTGRIAEPQADAVLAAIAALYSPVDAPVSIDAISVLEQPNRDGRFRVIGRFPLTGQT